VSPILRGWSGLEPREGQAAACIPRAQGSMVWRVAVEGGRLHGGKKPGGRRVDFRGGAEYPKRGQTALVFEEELKWWETGLNGQDIRGGRHETVGCPSLVLVPENGELPDHVDGWQEVVRAIAEDGEEEGGGQSVTEERREADPWGRVALDRHESRLGFGQPFDEVGGGGERGGEPVAQPPDLGLGREDRPIKVDRSFRDGGSLPVRTPVDELRFGD